ncbi:saccharopine dehydrogenase NADP-binding domain-containing protein [Tissierella sp. MB52-C2]|uniref:saccharopine dehydrogenase family protein n=1 Tax=Tissierella sp. MB52-C2 TaxID=3070999 RepID=UPI00280BFCBA|nr:saccharopine dehydrogenase NADP-binding domain-containing protein [Tissierella sp. MB52-C2]WMM24534.1 saccharopine dehydrogenase NADP-binding domain-containing protein [Tissierella sp. MB52-C2]
MKIVVLGGSGAQGIFAVESLLKGNVFDEIVLAGRNLEKIEKVIKQFNSPKLSAAQVDIFNKEKLMDLICSADIVANCTGPYYLLGEQIINATIEAGVNYVDYCDDVIVHEKVFTEESQKLAKEKNISVIVGLGASPGLIPLMAMNSANELDKVEDINIYMAINNREPEGPAVLDHTIENFFGQVPLIKDGEKIYENGFEGKEVYDFGPPFGNLLVSTMGHPEVFSLPRVLPEIKNLVIKLGVFPSQILELFSIFSAVGLASKKPLMVNGMEVVPRDFLISLLMSHPPRTELLEGEPETIYSATSVEVKGTKDNYHVTHKYDFLSQMGPVTSIPLALGAEMLAQGKIDKTGILVPEECLDPKSFIDNVIERAKNNNYPITLKKEIKINSEWI